MGVQFLSPLLLAGLLTAAIPIVLHLIQRRQAKLLPIGTLRFLRQIPARTIRKRRLEEYILLAARTLLLAFLALGAAHPVLTSAEAAGGATSAVVVLDDSWSMEYRAAGITRFQEGVEAVLNVLRTLSPGDRAAFLLTSDPDTGSLSNDLHGLRRKAGAVRPATTAPDLLAACRKGLMLLREAKEPNRELVLVTDLQRRAVEPLVRGLSEEEGDRGIRVVLVDVGADDPRDLAVTRVACGAGVAVAGEPIRVSATLRNFSPQGTATRVSLVLGGRKVGERRVALKAGETLTVSLQTTAEVPGTVQGKVTVEGDDLLRDDRRWFTLPVATRIPVLLVNGDPSPIPYQDESFYIRAALAPDEMGATGVTSPVNLSTIEIGDLPTEDLSPYRTVILANVPALSPRAATAIRSFVLSGGGLLVFAGNRIRPDAFQSALGTDPREGILPGVLSAPTQLGEDAEAVIPLASADPDHPLFADLPRKAMEDLPRVHVRRAMGIDPRPAGGRTVAKLEDGTPFILSKTPGRGRVLFVNSTADADWGNLPLRPLFLPLLLRAVRWLAGAGETGDLLMGEMVKVPAPSPRAPPPEITDPSGDIRRLAGKPEAKGNLIWGPLVLPGVYVVKGAGTGVTLYFAANVDPAESDLSRAAPGLLEDLFGKDRFHTIRGAARVSTLLAGSRKGRPVWGLLLGAALALLLFEGAFANRIARRRALSAARKGAVP